MAKRVHDPHFVNKPHSQEQEKDRVRELLELLTHESDDVILKTLAFTDWMSIPKALADRLLAPLAFSENSEIRQLTALQLSSIGPSYTDSLAEIAISMLAEDPVEDVRVGVRDGASGLTEFQDSVTNRAGELLSVKQDGENAVFSIPTTDPDEIARLKKHSYHHGGCGE